MKSDLVMELRLRNADKTVIRVRTTETQPDALLIFERRGQVKAVVSLGRSQLDELADMLRIAQGH